MPTNLYGPNDNYDLQKSHVLPAFIRKFHVAKEAGTETVEIWGSGTPKREFLHVDDLANACLFLMLNYDGESHINIGTGEDISIRDLALLVKKITDYQGELKFDVSRPDGTPRKLLDVSLIHNIGWQHTITLEEGIRKVMQELAGNNFTFNR